MNYLADVLREVGETGVRNPRINTDLTRFINRAQKRIQARASWRWMHNLEFVTIAANTQTANMPAVFKELAPEKSPVAYLGPSGGNPAYVPLPVRVVTRAECQRAGPWPGTFWQDSNPAWGYAAFNYPLYTVFMEQNAGGLWTINLPPQMQNNQALPLQCEVYEYLPDLALGSDTNALLNLDEGFDMVVNLTKAIAYAAEDPGDPRIAPAMQLYQVSYRQAVFEDARKELAGQSKHW